MFHIPGSLGDIYSRWVRSLGAAVRARSQVEGETKSFDEIFLIFEFLQGRPGSQVALVLHTDTWYFMHCATLAECCETTNPGTGEW